MEEQRKRQIEAAYQKAAEICLAQEAERLEKWYPQHRDEVHRSFMECMKAGLERLAGYQRQGLKGDLRHVRLSFLLSGVYLGQHLLKIDFYDHRYFGDPYDFDWFWDYTCLFPWLRENLEFIEVEMKREVIGLKRFEVRDSLTFYRREEARVLERYLEYLFQDTAVIKILENQNTADIKIEYGGYLSDSKQIALIRKRGEC